ncbi:immunoglobulin-like domain-containing protein [Polaribacter sp. Hel1_85]|uniref:immunoglobulin-like domain-containing protein n=1 Tax=Polaribacter sp. Hel1_85 TaxID=1250005 RepID=UPI00052BE05B|nr:immunoglobulin-like domain-containing protein [Polaribacter sp. Hel1_85]KGL62071.1 peptidase, S8 family [Polaribacter sp. Hel1_85]
MKKGYLSKLIMLGVFFTLTFNLNAQKKVERKKISGKYNIQKLSSLKKGFKEKSIIEKEKAIKIAKEKGWQTKFTTKDGRMLELQKVVDGKPIYYTTFNVAAAKSTRVDHLNSGGSLGLNLDGQNMTAYVWDGGVARASHQEYDGAGGTNRFSTGDSGALNYHSAHVTGTIIASGVDANAKGMASHAEAIGYDWNSDLAEATTAATNGMLISNHSYGYAARNSLGQVQLPQYYFGGYIEDSRDWDDIMFNAPNYLMVVAAGNDGTDDTANTNPTGGSGFDKLTGHSTSKNNLVVAAANDANVDANGNLISTTIATFSSEGPTDDFRIKPDIAGNGVSVYSTYENSDTAYSSISGTSMASPNVAGSLLLLQQHANNVNGSYMKAATLKGLALHTADDSGVTGPDAVFGWGLMNTKAAAEAITQNGNESKIEELTLTSGQTYTITVDSDGVNDLLASISWTDRAGTANTGTVNLTTPVLVNDLDIRVSKGATTYFPYELTGATSNAQQDNNVDPYERVDVSGASGTYTITVTNKGSLTGGSQNYSLIITGLTGTPVVCNATVPTNVSATNVSDTEATISWDAVPAATYDVRYRVSGTTSWTTNAVTGSSTVLSGLSLTTSYEVQVRSKCTSGNSAYSSTANFTTTELQLNYCTSNGNSVADEYISNVTMGSINNTTGASGSGYADYTSQSTNLTKGASETITITPTWTGTQYNEGYGVFIDYNKDGDFADSGETVWTNAASQTTPVSGTFTVPASAVSGATTMRVVMQYNTIPSACGSYDYGETEDYTVVIASSGPDTIAPVITLNGASTINLNVGDTYNDQGATATDNVDGNLTSSIVTTGTVNTNVVGSYTINYNVSDAAGNPATQVSRTVNVSDGTAPVITLNGASTINLNVGDTYTEQGATATDNVDGNLTSSIVITGSVNTNLAGTYAINYNVSDAAGNPATQVSRTVNVNNVSTGGCTNGVSTFPYNEGFENTLGAWTQSSADDIDWTINSGGTPSSSTGPSSANQGTYYIYVEASGTAGYPTKQAIINSPCYDLSNETEATFSFNYHMYGAADMGTIALEISSDNGASWTSIWNESGNKGNSWLTASVNLNAYVGGSVQLRFNRVTGSTWQADIALDNVQITNGGSSGSGCVAEITSFPYSQGFENTLGSWSQSAADDIDWSVNSSGTPSSNTGPASANQGTYYIFVEASGSETGYPTKQAIINSPCFDLSGLSVASFNFDYHMYGATDMGTIALEASNDNGVTWTSIWSQSGNKGNSWFSASVDLSSYLGNTVQLRFNRVTGSTWQADVAIDNISLSNTAANNTSLYTTYSVNTINTFKMYPNPAKDLLNVRLATDGKNSFRIIDVIGKTVKSGSISNQAINISNLKTGIYLIEINDGEEIIIEKFIKQ